MGVLKSKSCECPFCPKKFGRRGDLNRHKRIHTGERPYICLFPGCKRAFTQGTALKTHANTHTKAKPYVCGLAGCTAVFGDPSSCSRHRREKHNKLLGYRCPVADCKTQIKRHSSFVSHLDKKHNMRLPTSEEIARMRVVPQIQPEEEGDFKSEILEWTPDPEVYSMPHVRGYIHETKLEDSDEVEDVPSRCTSVASSASMPSPLSIADMRLAPVSCLVPNAYEPQFLGQVHVFDETNALSFVSSGSPPQLYPYIGYLAAPSEPGLSDSFSGVSGGPYYEQQNFSPYVTLDGYLSPVSASTSSASSPSPSSTPHLSLDYVSSQIAETASLDFTSYDYPALPADWSQQTLQFPYVVDSYNDF